MIDHHTLDADVAGAHAFLWPATLGYFFEQLLAGTVDDATIERVRSLFVDNVRNRGPLPSLRIGRTPYGILPVTALSRIANDPVAAALHALRGIWQRSAANVPRVGSDGIGAEHLARVLAQEPVSTSYVARSVLGPVYNAYLHEFVRSPLPVAWWDRQRTIADDAWTAAGFAAPQHRLARATFADDALPIASTMIGAAPVDQPLAFLTSFTTATIAEIRAAVRLPGETPLAYHLARHALLASTIATARGLLRARGVPGDFLDPELVGVPSARTSAARSSPWTWLEAPFAVQNETVETIRAALERLRAGTPYPPFAQAQAGLARIAKLPAARVDTLFREALDVCAFRIDAWITAFASARLAELRRAEPEGVLIGAYGWVERLRRDSVVLADVVPEGEADELRRSTRTGGYIHAPSLQHATTAAVLRSGYLAHGAEGAFAIDLSSARARAGGELLAAVREGRTLGTVLGRRFERALVASRTPVLGDLIPAFRAHAPASNGSDTATGARVVDGHALVRDRDTIPWGQRGLPAAGSPEHVAIQPILDQLADVIDATADTLVAESVHQLAGGATDRAGGVLDVAAGGPPPSELHVLASRSAGLGVEHSVMIAVPVTARGWAKTPRAVASPAVEAWCAAMLGAPERHAAVVRFGDREMKVTLADLAIGAIDVVLGVADLAARAIDHAATHRPAGANAEIQLETASLDDVTVLATALARVLGAARALTPQDLGVDVAPAAITDLTARATHDVIADALAALADDPRRGLLAAANLGVPGAVPVLDPSAWPAQAAAAASVLTARAERLANLGQPTADPVAHALARIEILVGGDTRAGLRMKLPPAIAQAFDDQAPLVGADHSTVPSWLVRVGRVRDGVGRLDHALLLADALHGVGDAALDLRVAQLPRVAAEPWIGRPVFGRERPPSARRSFVAHVPCGIPEGELGGLVIDTWSEVIPSPAVTTGPAFEYDQPGAQAPQAVLLAVCPDETPAWSVELLEEILGETIELVHARAVDGETLDGAGQYLPAIYLALNLAGDTASSDLFPES